MINTEKQITIDQSVAILIDGNNLELSIGKILNDRSFVLDYENFVPKILKGRKLKFFSYFREGKTISRSFIQKLSELFMATVTPCNKNADIVLTIKAVNISNKVDTIIIFSGDSDYYDLVVYLKNQGVRVEIVSIKETTGSSLLTVCDNFTFIKPEDLIRVFSKK